LFFFFYISDITVNALFFTDSTIHKIYVDSGKFNLSYQLPQIIYSFLISNVINSIIEYLSLSDESIISIKGNNINNLLRSKKIIKCMKIKFLSFFIIILISLIFPIFINLIPGIFRISALRDKKGNQFCLYKFSQFIEIF